VPFLAMGFIMMLLALVVVHLWYRVPMHGSLLLLLVFSVVYIVCVLSVGLLISTLSTTQQQAVFLAFFFSIFAILTSGLFAPIHNMPRALQYLTYLNPVRYFMEIVRGIYLKGTGIDVLWRQGAALAAWALVAMSLAVLRFHKRAG
jgi:ABC-2 type transport system permease protein